MVLVFVLIAVEHPEPVVGVGEAPLAGAVADGEEVAGLEVFGFVLAEG